MATRLYLPSSAAAAAPNSPAFDASWEVTASAIRRTLELTKDEITFATSAVATALNSPAGAVDVLIAQFISAPIASNVTINGTFSGQMRAQENNATGDLRIQCVVRVLQSDYSTVRGTLIASNAGALSHEFNTSLRNISIPLGGSTSVSSVAAQTGDVLVVELGYRKHESATTSRTGTFDLGAVSGGTDLAVDETTTTQNVPWVEFSNTITFATATTRDSYVTAQAAITPPDVDTRASFVTAQAAVTPPTVDTRASFVVAQVAILTSGAVAGTTRARAWGYIIE